MFRDKLLTIYYRNFSCPIALLICVFSLLSDYISVLIDSQESFYLIFITTLNLLVNGPDAQRQRFQPAKAHEWHR